MSFNQKSKKSKEVGTPRNMTITSKSWYKKDQTGYKMELIDFYKLKSNVLE
jgi:hypothetical protein